MSREKEAYQANLIRVLERFPAQELIPLKEAGVWLGIDSRKLQRVKDFPAKKVGGRYMVSVVQLARWLS